MQAIISNRIYLQYDDSVYSCIRKLLTYSIPQGRPGAPNIEICDVQRIRNAISIPIGRQDLIPQHYEIIDKRIDKPVYVPKPTFVLRESQQHIYDNFSESCIILGKVGFGKTITALSLIHKLQQKTLILVHTSILLDQWKREIKKWFNIDAGVIQAKNFEINNPIVIATVQTAIKYTDNISKEFGVVIVDEAHHTPASTFTKILNKSKAKYKIALTGTMNRKDGMGVMIPDYFFPKYFQPKQENIIKPEVHIYSTDIQLPVAKDWVTKVSLLLQDPEYIELLYTLCKVYVQKGHKVLLVSDRIALLEELYELLPESILVTSKTKDRERELALINGKDRHIILGSVGIFKEGTNIPILSCLIFGMQVSDNLLLLEQVIGRIMRKDSNKCKPVVVDTVLTGGMGLSQAAKRYAFYSREGYTIKNFYA